MNIKNELYDLPYPIPLEDGSVSPKKYGQYLQNKRKRKK